MNEEYSTRRAHMDDVKGIHSLLLETAQKRLLLPRALIYLYSHVRNFWVLINAQGEIVGCCALAPVWEDLAEICSLVVKEELRGKGLGRRIVEACLSDCHSLHLKKIFALTYQREFFRHMGFQEVDKSILPQKIWADCVHCPRYPDDCDETAVFLTFEDA